MCMHACYVYASDSVRTENTHAYKSIACFLMLGSCLLAQLLWCLVRGVLHRNSALGSCAARVERQSLRELLCMQAIFGMMLRVSMPVVKHCH